MSITFCNKYTAEGPYTDTGSLKKRSGVYAVLSRAKNNDKWTVLDVGESHDVKTRVENHERAPCWKRNNKGAIGYAPYYTPNKQQAERVKIEQEIRAEYNPPCGDR